LSFVLYKQSCYSLQKIATDIHTGNGAQLSSSYDNRLSGSYYHDGVCFKEIGATALQR